MGDGKIGTFHASTSVLQGKCNTGNSYFGFKKAARGNKWDVVENIWEKGLCI